MNMPEFFIIGAAKAGTTALFEYLRQHPDVYLPNVKETNYFHFYDKNIDYVGPGDVDEISRFSLKTRVEYEAAYKGAEDKVKGDISPVYLYDKYVAGRIYLANPNAKIIVILREPSSRAISQYNHAVRQLREQLSFSEALKAEKSRLESGYEFFWAYKDAGFYWQQLKPYYDNFSFEQIKVIKYDDFISKQQEVMQEIFHFLGVDNFEVKISKSHNAAGMPKNRLLHKIIRMNLVKDIYHKLMSKRIKSIVRRIYYNINMGKNEAVDSEIVKNLKLDYIEDIRNLEKLTKIEFKEWY